MPLSSNCVEQRLGGNPAGHYHLPKHQRWIGKDLWGLWSWSGVSISSLRGHALNTLQSQLSGLLLSSHHSSTDCPQIGPSPRWLCAMPSPLILMRESTGSHNGPLPRPSTLGGARTWPRLAQGSLRLLALVRKELPEHCQLLFSHWVPLREEQQTFWDIGVAYTLIHNFTVCNTFSQYCMFMNLKQLLNCITTNENKNWLNLTPMPN